MNGASSTRAAIHKGESVDGIVFSSLLVLTQADRSFARVFRSVQLVVGVFLEFPRSVPVRHVDSLLPHTSAELFGVIAEGALEEIARG